MAEEQSTRQRVSATAFAGRETAPAQQDPETIGILNRNSLQLSVVANQVRGLNAQVTSLTSSMQAIGNSLATSQALERRKEEQEQALEARLAQQQLREGQESVVEKKIQARAIAPAQKLAQVAQFTLSRLGNLFMSLIGAWLGSRAVDTINALSQGNTEELNKIKKEVLTGLAAITGVYIGSKLGLRLLTGGFGKVGMLLAAAAAVGLFTKPGRDLMDFAKEGAKKIVSALATAVGLPDPFASGGQPDNTQTPPPPPPDNTTPNPDGTPAPAQTPQIDPTKPPSMQGQGGPELPAKPTETLMGQKIDPKIQELEGQIESQRSMLMMNQITKEEFDKEKQKINTQIEEIKSGKGGAAQISTQPQETMMGKPAAPMAEAPAAETSGTQKSEAPVNQEMEPEYGRTSLKAEELTEEEKKNAVSAPPPVEGNMSNAPQAEQMKPGGDNVVQVNAEVKNYSVQENYVSRTGKLAAEVTPMKKNTEVAQKVSQPEPAPAINVVPITIPSSSSSAPQGPAKPAASGAVGNTPSFATGNSDNMWLLGAYSNFNVVPV